MKLRRKLVSKWPDQKTIKKINDWNLDKFYYGEGRVTKKLKKIFYKIENAIKFHLSMPTP